MKIGKNFKFLDGFHGGDLKKGKVTVFVNGQGNYGTDKVPT